MKKGVVGWDFVVKAIIGLFLLLLLLYVIYSATKQGGGIIDKIREFLR